MKSRATSLIILLFIVLQYLNCISRDTDKINFDFKSKIDSLIITDSIRPFNGQILIAKSDSIICSKTYGYSNFVNKTKLTKDHQFVIGSLSKQITAVLVLQAVERGFIKLNDPIKIYLPYLPMNWADEVTVHQLLNHTHGISDLAKALDYKPGTDFAYSNLGYELLGKILESVSHKSYIELCTELFKKYGMKNSSAPGTNYNFNLTQAWSRDSLGIIWEEKNTFQGSNLPAAYILSTAEDLLLWNNLLHNGILLTDESYELMIKPGAIQNHALFGKVGYGFALRINNSENILEIGHTGYVPGYLSMNFYYPDSKINIIVLENLDWKDENIKKTFYFELKIRELLKRSNLL
ncbi:MAG: serine hydrolase [Bacteroidales bacterium]|nr:serine hydrolase [Bacteroidales bacterium]